MVPFYGFPQIQDGKDGEDGQGNDFLHAFKLSCRVIFVSDAVCGNLKTIFEKSDAPADQNDCPQGSRFEFQVPVPGKRHENIGGGQKQYGIKSLHDMESFQKRSFVGGGVYPVCFL